MDDFPDFMDPLMDFGGSAGDSAGRFAGQISVRGMFGDASGEFQGQVFPDGTIGDASGNFVGRVFPDGTIGASQFGFEISGTNSEATDFTCNSFSMTIN